MYVGTFLRKQLGSEPGSSWHFCECASESEPFQSPLSPPCIYHRWQIYSDRYNYRDMLSIQSYTRSAYRGRVGHIGVPLTSNYSWNLLAIVLCFSYIQTCNFFSFFAQKLYPLPLKKNILYATLYTHWVAIAYSAPLATSPSTLESSISRAWSKYFIALLFSPALKCLTPMATLCMKQTAIKLNITWRWKWISRVHRPLASLSLSQGMAVVWLWKFFPVTKRTTWGEI